jgi:hypothetical protein
MSTHGAGPTGTQQAPPPAAPTAEQITRPAGPGANRLTTETKASFKTTEFFAYVAAVLGVLIAAATISGGGDHVDIFTANKAWLYVTILTVGYMISRGLAKAGTRDPYWDRPSTGGDGAPLTERIKSAAQVLADGEPGAHHSNERR